MYHLIIADDEEKICEGIGQTVSLGADRFQVKAEMHSGQEILDFLKKKETRVDVTCVISRARACRAGGVPPGIQAFQCQNCAVQQPPEL